MKKHKHKFIRVGGPEYRKSEKCEVCKRDFSKVRFSHHFKTTFGSFDTCESRVLNLYETVMTDIAGGVFSLKKDIEEIRSFLGSFMKSKKWRDIVEESQSSKRPLQRSTTRSRGHGYHGVVKSP